MTDTNTRPVDQPEEAKDEISVLDLLIVLAKHKLLIIGLPLVAAIASAAFSLRMTDIYTASAKLMPPQQSQSTTASLLAQLSGGLAGLVGSAGGLKSSNDIYIAMLNSRTLADSLIQRLGLAKPEDKYPSSTRAALAGVSRISTGKDGLILIEVDDPDPKHAADIANGYVDELIKMTGSLAVTEASQRRLFFERQFAQAKDNLAKAEVAARQALERGDGVVKVEEQGRAIVESTARLRGQIMAKEVQIGAMRSFANERNPDLLFALKEVESMKRELGKMEGTGNAQRVENVRSAQGTESLRLLREVKYNEVIFELLAKQFEMAKIEEAKDPSIIQVMDKAVPPDFKSKPNRRNFVVQWTALALVLAILLAYVIEATSRVSDDPRQAERVRAFKRHLSLRS